MDVNLSLKHGSTQYDRDLRFHRAEVWTHHAIESDRKQHEGGESERQRKEGKICVTQNTDFSLPSKGVKKSLNIFL